MYLLNELKAFRKKEKISMHIPGHKNGRGIGAYFAKNAFNIDVTELLGTDNLQKPDGILKKSQEKCASIFGAQKTYFLTGGSSLGIRASILGTTKRNEKLLVDRTCHRSVIDAIVLCGICPVFLEPEFKNGVYTGILKETVETALEENPDAVGMIITSPTYYGIVSDISSIAKVLHAKNKFLIVDEAHGAHFAFSDELPDTALKMGTDICIQSAHKTLPALGQASYLHIGKTNVDIERVERALKMLQSTSPSYMLMAALDYAAEYMQVNGKKELKRLILAIEKLKREVSKKTDITFLETSDKTRIVADFSASLINSRQAEAILAKKNGIYAEMSDFRYIVFIPSVSNKSSEIKCLSKALIKLCKKTDGCVDENIPLPKISLKMPIDEAFDKDFLEISIKKALGKTCAEVVSACPPGAAVAVPGQEITKDIIDYIIKNDVCEKIKVVK